MCTQSCLAATLIKRAHGANKSFFVFFGFIPMKKSQRSTKILLGSFRTVPRPFELFSLFDALRGFDLHQIPSTKELTCLFWLEKGFQSFFPHKVFGFFISYCYNVMCTALGFAVSPSSNQRLRCSRQYPMNTHTTPTNVASLPKWLPTWEVLMLTLSASGICIRTVVVLGRARRHNSKMTTGSQERTAHIRLFSAASRIQRAIST